MCCCLAVESYRYPYSLIADKVLSQKLPGIRIFSEVDD